MMQTVFFAKVPFVSVPVEVIKEIVKTLKLNEGSIVYDLGCGNARVLSIAQKIHPKAHFVGVELIWWAYMLAKLRIWKNRQNKNIKILCKNFFQVNVSNATHVFLYLYPEAMDKLLPKLEKELKKGTRVVSATFKFSQKQYTEKIDLHRDQNQLARTLYVYEF